MVGPPYTGQMERDLRVKRLSEHLERLCLELGVPFLPIFTFVDGNEIWRQEAECGDGVHPNRLGYTLIYRAVLAWQAWRDWVP
jgi:lysophospholipase L1-like esterase